MAYHKGMLVLTNRDPRMPTNSVTLITYSYISSREFYKVPKSLGTSRKLQESLRRSWAWSRKSRDVWESLGKSRECLGCSWAVLWSKADLESRLLSVYGNSVMGMT